MLRLASTLLFLAATVTAAEPLARFSRPDSLKGKKPSPPTAVAFLENGTLLVGGLDGLSRWDPSTKAVTSESPSSPVHALAAFGTRVYVGGPMLLTQVAPSTNRQAWETTHERVEVVTLSADGRRLLHTQSESTLSLLDTAKGEYGKVLEFASRPVAAALGGNGRVLCVATRDGGVRGYRIGVDGHPGTLWSRRVGRSDRGAAAFTPDGRLAALSLGGWVLIVEAITGRPLTSIERKFAEGDVRCLAYSPDGLRLVVGMEAPRESKDATTRVGNGALRVFATESGRLLESLPANQGDVVAVAFSADGTRIASAGSDNTVALWAAPESPKPLEPWTLSEAWDVLDTLEPSAAHRVMAALLADKAQAVPKLRAGLLALDADQVQLKKWAGQLDHDAYRVRDAARKALIARGLRAAAVLTDPKRVPLSAEGEQNVRLILEELDAKGVRVPEGGLYGDPLRIVRGVRMLEAIGTPEAKAALEEAAKPGNDARLVKEAKAALAWMR